MIMIIIINIITIINVYEYENKHEIFNVMLCCALFIFDKY